MRSLALCLLLTAGMGSVRGPLQRPEPPIPSRSLGASDYQAIGDPRVDHAAFAAALAGLGVTFTRVWLIDAWAAGSGEPGTYDGVLPVKRRADGRWDLDAWNPAYFERVLTFATEMNRRRIVPVFTLLELYAWSDSKQGLLWVPDQSRGLFRANVNGVHWGDPDGPTFAGLPDDWLRTFSCRIVETLRSTLFVIELGNEMPDPHMHERLLQHLRSDCGYRGAVQVSRERDTPGVFRAMGIGQRYDLWSIHGARDASYLDAAHPGGDGHPTFRALFDSGIDMAHIIVSSDGARASTDVERAYDYAGLRVVALDILRRGGSYEHQLALKLRRFRDGRYDLADLKYDAGFLRDLSAAARPR